MKKSKGQVLVMCTLVLMTMCGVLGLAVDLGWSYFRKKAAQGAVDSAAISAAQAVLESVGEEGPWDCADPMNCQEPVPCSEAVSNPPADSMDVACLYAQQNGFQVGGNGGRQNVMVAGGVLESPPTAPGVWASYWVTVRAAETIPQLFSSLLMNSQGTISARATAAVIDSVVPGSLILLNRENDCLPMGSGNSSVCGVNALIQANDNQGVHALQAEGGIMMASLKHGADGDGRYAGEDTGGGMVSAPFTYIRGAGSYVLGGSATWVNTPVNGKRDTMYFKDPLRGKGQPPPPTGLVDRPVPGALIQGSDNPNNPLVLLPGNYYATAIDNQGTVYASGDPIRMSGSVVFSDGSTGFGKYVFFGGITTQSAGTSVTFGPGQYVFAGAKSNNSAPQPLFDIRVNMVVKDLTTGYDAPTDAGEIFVFTDANYRGGVDGEIPLEIPSLVQEIKSELKFGMSGFQTGNTDATFINLHGLNREHPLLPPALKPFAPIIMWQDQSNSIVKYTPRGYIDTSCGQPECPNTALINANSAELIFQASPNLHMWGVSYQPRGSWTSMIGGGGYDAPLQLISGAIRVHANSNVHLRPLNLPLVRKVVGLVE